MICVTIYFHIFEFNSSIILNMILSFCPFSFYISFFYFPWSMAPFWRCSFPDDLWIPELNLHLFSVASVHFNLWIKYDWSRKLNLGHQLIYITFINGINSINHFFPMPRCTYTSINYYGVTLWHHWHQVQCRGTSVLFSTTISVFPYFTQWFFQYFLFLVN